MKRNGLLWILMLTLIVPALALSGCKEKKNGRDKDDEKSSTEKSEKKKKKKDEIDIVGEYEMDKESAMMLLDAESNSDDEHYDPSIALNLHDNKKLEMTVRFEASIYASDLDNTLNYTIEAIGRGTWEYDEKDKLLTLDIVTANIDYCDVNFVEDNEATDKFIEENGGIEGLKQQLKEAFNPNNLCEKKDFKITELTDDGFFARTVEGDIHKVRFIRVD